MYYDKRLYKLLGYRKSTRKGKMYDAILHNKLTNRLVHVPFGSSDYENYRDKTGLNLYPHLIHGNKKRRINYKKRHQKDIVDGFYSPGWFSMYILW